LLLTPVNLAANIKSNQMRSTLVAGGKVTAVMGREKEFAATAAPVGGLAFDRSRDIEKERIETCTRGRGKTCGNHRVSALSIAVLAIASSDLRQASRLFC
jgi:hypothetical protein